MTYDLAELRELADQASAIRDKLPKYLDAFGRWAEYLHGQIERVARDHGAVTIFDAHDPHPRTTIVLPGSVVVGSVAITTVPRCSTAFAWQISMTNSDDHIQATFQAIGKRLDEARRMDNKPTNEGALT